MTDRLRVRLPAVLTIAFLLLFIASLLQAPVRAATPTVGPNSPSTAEWDFPPQTGAGSGGTPIEGACAAPQCYKQDVSVVLPQPDNIFYQTHSATFTFRCTWTSAAPSDLDCFAFSPTGGETGPGKPDTQASGDNYEDVVINNPASGTWSLRSDAAVGANVASHGIATLVIKDLPPGLTNQVPKVGDARFTNFDFDPTFQGKDGLGRPNAGEPSVGVNWETGKVMYMAGGKVTQLTYDHSSPPKPTAVDVTPADSVLNEDAILFTDHVTNRTYAMGLLLPASYLDFTDTDGSPDALTGWTATAAGCGATDPGLCGPDHETLASGPFHQPAPSGAGYSRAVYYCAQTIVRGAYCGRSDDGGLIWNPIGTELWHNTCSPLHGHVRVGYTGDVYIPNASCTDAAKKGRQGVTVSEDNGATFTVYTIPDSTPGTSDPSVSEGPDGSVYFGYQDASGHPKIAVSHDHGKHWDPSIDVGRFADPTTEDGLTQGIQNTEFSEVITGDAGRAAFAFLGTGKQGAYQDGAFDGTWYLFVSYTFDKGQTWRTVNATPNDPVQRGCVWNGGLVNACRNMLDFNDISLDKQGHVYVAYTDGCTTNATYSCDNTPGVHGWTNEQSGDQAGCKPSEIANTESDSTCTFARLSAIVRQVCGRGLIADYDPGFNEADYCVKGASTTVTGTSPTPLILPGTNGLGGAPNLPLAALFLAGAAVSASFSIGGRRRRERARQPGTDL